MRPHRVGLVQLCSIWLRLLVRIETIQSLMIINAVFINQPLDYIKWTSSVTLAIGPTAVVDVLVCVFFLDSRLRRMKS